MSTSGWPLLTLVLGLALSLGLAWRQGQTNQQQAQIAFDALTEQVAADVLAQFQRYEYGLRGARGTVLTAGEYGLTRGQFLRYAESRDIDIEFPGARGFGFIRRVPVERESAFIEQARADGWPDFRIKQLSPHDGERFVIQYIEPVDRNAQAVGLDIASEANRRQAAVTAMRDGVATISGPITLVQASGQPLRSFLLLLPVYASSARGLTPAQRDQSGYGWAYAPLVTDEVLRNVNLHADKFSLRLADVTERAEGEVFFEAGRATQPEPTVNLSTEVERKVFGRNWKMTLQARLPGAAQPAEPQHGGCAGRGTDPAAGGAAGLAAECARAPRRSHRRTHPPGHHRGQLQRRHRRRGA
jgi:CHASE1-domain containing sensor protein